MPTARRIDSGFPLSHDTYNGLSAASDGCIYYVLCTESYEAGGRMFRYDSRTGEVHACADLTQACGESGAVPQSKSHVNFHEHEGKLYFATHVGIYSIFEGRETMPIPPEGVAPYPGGHFLAHDLANGAIEDLGVAPHGEGILAMTMDGPRQRAYAITWPYGHFLVCDTAARTIRDLGRISELGEAGRGPTYRTLCRAIQVDPRDGSAYFSVSEGTIFRYPFDAPAYHAVQGDDLRKDYFGLYDPASPGHMAYNWRQTVWHARSECIYGVHGNSGYLFRFDPRGERVQLLQRITSLPSQRCGMFDQFSYGYLGFTLGPDGNTIYYLTGGPLFDGGRRVAGRASTARGEAKGEENLHLVTYHIPSEHYQDHGPVLFADGTRPSYVNSIAVGADGVVYALARPGSGTSSDLIEIR
ncbi:MAG: hypothetical protein FJW39_24290 [Acidobacteria bacterium]|nr:hypothetical protein [Acidobacteriota bacterium]